MFVCNTAAGSMCLSGQCSATTTTSTTTL
jgi:hypothetical protein